MEKSLDFFGKWEKSFFSPHKWQWNGFVIVLIELPKQLTEIFYEKSFVLGKKFVLCPLQKNS